LFSCNGLSSHTTKKQDPRAWEGVRAKAAVLEGVGEAPP